MQRYHNLDFLRAFAMIMELAMLTSLFWARFAKMFGIENIAPAEEWININWDISITGECLYFF